MQPDRRSFFGMVVAFLAVPFGKLSASAAAIPQKIKNARAMAALETAQETHKMVMAGYQKRDGIRPLRRPLSGAAFGTETAGSDDAMDRYMARRIELEDMGDDEAVRRFGEGGKNWDMAKLKWWDDAPKPCKFDADV